MLLFIRIAAVTLLSTGHSVFAQESAQSVDPIIVTANRMPQNLSSALSEVQIINAEEIARSSGGSLTSLLQARAGIEISSTGGPGQPSGIFMRGTNSNHVVILLDGVRINSATSGTTALEHIPLNQIERIEILSGAASSLYGADAIGGVINVMTNRSHDAGDKLQLSTLVGSQNNSNYSISYNSKVEATQIQFGAGYAEGNNRSATNERVAFGFNPDRDPYRNKNFRLGVSHEISRDHLLGLSYVRSNGVTHFDSGPGDDINRQTLDTLKFESNNRFVAGWDSLIRLARSRDKFDITGTFSSRFATTQDQLQWENRINSDIGTITAGADATRQQVDSDTIFSQTRRDIVGVYAGVIQEQGAHQWQLNARHDNLSGYGGYDVGSIAYAYKIRPGLRAELNAGTAFKAPTFNDLYYAFDGFFKGNPDLKPERSRNLEAALEYREGNRTARLTHYRNRLDNLIIGIKKLDIISNSEFSTVGNLARARIAGTSLRIGQTQNNLSLRADLTFQNATDDTTGNMLQRRVRRYASFGASYQNGGMQYGGDVIASGARYDSPLNAPDNRMGGYALLNLFARMRLSASLNLQARIENALDKEYELAQGYNTMGRRFFAGLEWQTK
ncbi:MAG: TonB-dependent receptor [Burkholderiales bacterium]